MRNGKEMNSCLFGEELVTYVYDELPITGRETFERHLLDCSECTAELADISLSRLGVYEWHRDEFVPLATPQFVIPYEPKDVATPKLSWINALRGLVTSPMRLATAGGAFAVVAFAVTFGVVFNSPSTSEVAVEQPETSSPVVSSSEQKTEVPAKVIAKQGSDEVIDPAPKREFRSVNSVQKVRPVQINAKRPSTQLKLQTTNAQTAPRLGNFVETEDKSLRLADLVADVDTKK